MSQIASLFEVISVFVTNNQITLIAATINFLWVYLEYKASVWLWPVGVVLPIFYIVVSLQANYYGNVLINVYFLITSVIGWWMWLRKGSEEDIRIKALPPKAGLYSLSVALPLYALLYLLIARYTDSVLAWADALSTVVSFVGMIWLAKKWREHWLCWIVSNALSVLIFYLSRDYVSVIVFVCNFLVAILGYIKWIKLTDRSNEVLS